jgi:hypothetical protein
MPCVKLYCSFTTACSHGIANATGLSDAQVSAMTKAAIAQDQAQDRAAPLADLQAQVADLQSKVAVLEARRTKTEAGRSIEGPRGMPQAVPVPLGQAVSDGRTRVTRDGHLVNCDSTGQAYEVTLNRMVIEDPIWKNGKPVKCRADMFAD